MAPIHPQVGFCIFSTAIGRCGIAWGGHGILAVQLPEANESRTRARILRLPGDARPAIAPAPVQRVMDDIVALLEGQRRDLRDAVLDMRALSGFQQRVYALTRAIEPGRTRSYGEIATLCGDAGAARAVGQALGRNPFPIIVPCHRVLAAGGKNGGFSAPGGVTTKLRLLTLESRLQVPAPLDRTAARGTLPLPF